MPILGLWCMLWMDMDIEMDIRTHDCSRYSGRSDTPNIIKYDLASFTALADFASS